MTSFDDYISKASTSYADAPQVGDGLMRVHWFNGDQRTRTRGAFFASSLRFGDHGITPGAPWREVSRAFNSGETEDGYEAHTVRISVLHVRKADIVFDADQQVRYIDRPPRGAPRPMGWSLHVEVLCMIEGLGIEQAVVWSSKRVKTSMAIMDVLASYKREITDPMRRETGRAFAPWWGWLTISGAVNDQKQPVYEKTKGAPVTPPTLLLPPGTARERAKRMWVGPEVAARGEELYKEFAEWATRPLGSAAPPAAPSHNTPQPIADDDDTPF